MKKIIGIILFFFLFINFSYASKSFSININWKEKLLIKTTSIVKYYKLKKIVDQKLELACYDNWKIESRVNFKCKNSWKNYTYKGCGIVVSSSFPYGNKNLSCKLRLKTNHSKYVNINLNIKNPFPERKVYPYNYDISAKMLKKSIQKRHLSCEISATSDILSSIKKRKIDEDELWPKLKKEGPWKFLYKDSKGRKIWGDPRKWFVWFVDKNPRTGRTATQTNYEWYWVYEWPINDLYKLYWVKTKIITKKNEKENWFYSTKSHLIYLLKELVNWNYVQMWWDFCTLAPYEDGTLRSFHIKQEEADKGLSGRNICSRTPTQRIMTWYIKKKDGSLELFKGLSWEHAFILLWYKGNIENPTHIIVWDTSTWKHTFPIKEWIRKWEALWNKSIIAYRK